MWLLNMGIYISAFYIIAVKFSSSLVYLAVGWVFHMGPGEDARWIPLRYARNSQKSSQCSNGDQVHRLTIQLLNIDHVECPKSQEVQ